jgi:carbon monoxide dehydrogenase subunit G
MARFEHTIEIACPPKAVFEFLADPLKLPLWQPSLQQLRPHGRGPLRAGLEVTEVRRFLGRELETTWLCTEHRPHRRSVIESDEGPVPFAATFDLEPVRDRTRFTWTVDVRGAAARLAGPLAAGITRRELAGNALRLKHLLEENRA